MALNAKQVLLNNLAEIRQGQDEAKKRYNRDLAALRKPFEDFFLSGGTDVLMNSLINDIFTPQLKANPSADSYDLSYTMSRSDVVNFFYAHTNSTYRTTADEIWQGFYEAHKHDFPGYLADDGDRAKLGYLLRPFSNDSAIGQAIRKSADAYGIKTLVSPSMISSGEITSVEFFIKLTEKDIVGLRSRQLN